MEGLLRSGAHLRSLLTLDPDDPITETGVKGELIGSGVSSRLGTGRTDVRHQLLDPVVVPGPGSAPSRQQPGRSAGSPLVDGG